MKLKVNLNRALSRGALPPGDRRFWFFFRSVALRIELRSTNLWIFEVFYRRALIVAGILTVVLWLSGATALHYWLKRVPHNQVAWLDLAAPWRWSGLRAKRGDTAVKAGLDDFSRRDIPRAFFNLRAGVARSPGNVDGRLMLARLQAAYDPVAAVKLLDEGLPFSYNDPKFINGLVALYSAQQRLTAATETLDGVLAESYGQISPLVRFVAAQARARLLVLLERYPEAEQAIAALQPVDENQQAAVDTVRIDLLLRTGKAAEARILAAKRKELSDAAAFRQAVDIAVALDDSAALRSAILQMKAKAPDQPTPYLIAFQAWHRLKRWTFRDEVESEFYRLFSTSDSALQALAALAVNLDAPEVLARTEGLAKQARLSPFAFQVHRTELALRDGHIEEAMRLLRDWENSVDTLTPAQRFYPEFIKRLTRAAFANTPEQTNYLTAHLASSRVQATLPVFTLATTVLMKVNNPTAARQVLVVSQGLYPRSEPLLKVKNELAVLAATTPAIPAAGKKDSTDATVVLVKVPESGVAATGEVQRLFEEEKLTAARDLLRGIRSQKPAWLGDAEIEVAALEVELALLTLDQVSSRNAVRSYFSRHRSEAASVRMVPVVKSLLAKGREADARLLYDELGASVGTTVEVQHALKALNLRDDLAELAATSASTVAAFDRFIAKEEWPQAERLMKYLKERPPAWLGEAAIEIKPREVRLRLATDQRPQALVVFRELVVKSGTPRGAAFALVRTLATEEKREQALLLAREVKRLLPDDKAAIDLLKEIEADAPIVIEG